jgi:hypothetical protein
MMPVSALVGGGAFCEFVGVLFCSPVLAALRPEMMIRHAKSQTGHKDSGLSHESSSYLNITLDLSTITLKRPDLILGGPN